MLQQTQDRVQSSLDRRLPQQYAADLRKTGHVMKLSRSQMVRWILFPAAIPEIFTGLRVGFSLTLIGSLTATKSESVLHLDHDQ